MIESTFVLSNLSKESEGMLTSFFYGRICIINIRKPHPTCHDHTTFFIFEELLGIDIKNMKPMPLFFQKKASDTSDAFSFYKCEVNKCSTFDLFFFNHIKNNLSSHLTSMSIMELNSCKGRGHYSRSPITTKSSH